MTVYYLVILLTHLRNEFVTLSASFWLFPLYYFGSSANFDILPAASPSPSEYLFNFMVPTKTCHWIGYCLNDKWLWYLYSLLHIYIASALFCSLTCKYLQMGVLLFLQRQLLKIIFYPKLVPFSDFSLLYLCLNLFEYFLTYSLLCRLIATLLCHALIQVTSLSSLEFKVADFILYLIIINIPCYNSFKCIV